MDERGGDRVLALRLREARLGAQLTQAELAERAGLTHRNVSDLETERRGRRVEPAMLRRLASALRVPVGYLLGDSEGPTPQDSQAAIPFRDAAGAKDLLPFDLTRTEEFDELGRRAEHAGITYAAPVRCRSRNTVVNGLRLRFLEWGAPESPTVLLLHVGSGSAHEWDLVALQLQDRYHLYALDQRGHGDSEWARDGDYSPTAVMDDLTAFCDQQGIRSAVVIGCGLLGGLCGAMVSVERPDIAQALVLVDVGPETPPARALVARGGANAPRSFDSLRAYIEYAVGLDPQAAVEDIRYAAPHELFRYRDGRLNTKTAPDMRPASPRSQFDQGPRRIFLFEPEELHQPTLLVRGDLSSMVSQEVAQRFASSLPRGELKTVARAAHRPHEQNPREFLNAIEGFLAAQR